MNLKLQGDWHVSLVSEVLDITVNRIDFKPLKNQNNGKMKNAKDGEDKRARPNKF